MGKDYRDEKNREKRFRGQKPDRPVKKDNPHKNKGHKGGQRFHENDEVDPSFFDGFSQGDR
jgi:hypothetical protein